MHIYVLTVLACGTVGVASLRTHSLVAGIRARVAALHVPGYDITVVLSDDTARDKTDAHTYQATT